LDNVIIKVEADSIAEELGIEPGDVLLDINDKKIEDVFDYRYLIQDEYIEVGIRKPDGDEWLLEIDKDEYEDLGIVFERGLMDRAHSCKNKCIFCFIDQLPKGMRESLYFKDDDSRLSFLHGNYITLTNMSDEDLDRIIFYHLSPINISVQVTDPEKRVFMLKNPNAVNLMPRLKKLAENKIEMNFQIVLCKGINDGEYLDRSIRELSEFIDPARCMSIVPFGMTKFRDGLYPIEPFDKESARAVIAQVEAWQEKLLKEKGTRFAFLGDEFYLMAELPLPNDEHYEGYPQLENGVGMMTLMRTEFNEELAKTQSDSKKRSITIATGKASFSFISSLACDIMKRMTNTHIDVYAIENNFFGTTITVSGLMTGSDIIANLKDKSLGKYLLVPENALRDDIKTRFLDDVDIADVEAALGVELVVTSDNGAEFLRQIIDLED
jgi:putative radical SAM enzyme (TIGR03279 family)